MTLEEPRKLQSIPGPAEVFRLAETMLMLEVLCLEPSGEVIFSARTDEASFCSADDSFDHVVTLMDHGPPDERKPNVSPGEAIREAYAAWRQHRWAAGRSVPKDADSGELLPEEPR